MTVGSASEELLPPNHWAALYDAATMLTDQFFDDVAGLLADGDFAQSAMAGYLPAKYLLRYNVLFAKQFLACLLTVAWKLRAPDYYPLACVAEELALHAIIECAEALLESEGLQADFTEFEDEAFEDADVEQLFDPALDGIENSELGQKLGMAHLRFEDWFRPFRGEDPVHPYVDPG
jgi:hypothetical protein